MQRTRLRRRAKPGVAAFRSPLGAFVAALALIVQFVVLPYHQALSTPIAAPAVVDVASVAAELKATFGDAASLCVQTDGAGGPIAPAGDCDDHCPLCRLAAQTAAVTPPAASALPERLDAGSRAICVAAEAGGVSFGRRTGNGARAPPVTV